MKHSKRIPLALAVCAGFALATMTGQAAVGQLGILDTSGTNPATGQPWKVGDKYHLIYVTTATTNAVSDDIATYNAFVQADATAEGMGTDTAGNPVTWTALGSTVDVSAIANSPITGPVINAWNSGTIALNSADLWDFQFPANSIHDLAGNLRNAWTGTTGGGLASGTNYLGTTGTNVRRHWTGWTNWIASSATQNKNDQLYMVGISQELTVIPEPSAAVLLGLGSLALLRRRRK